MITSVLPIVLSLAPSTVASQPHVTNPLVSDSITPSTPGVTVEQTGPNSRRYRIPFSVLLANDDLPGLAGAGYVLDTDDPVIVDGSTGNGGGWDDELGTVDSVFFQPSNNCSQSGSCEYQVRALDGSVIQEFSATISVSWTSPAADAVDDSRSFALGAVPYLIDVADNDRGIETNFFPPSFSLEVVGVESGGGNADIYDDGGVPKLRYRPVSMTPTVAVVRYRLIGCSGSEDTALATFAIGSVVLQDDYLSASTPGVVQVGGGYRIPYSALLANDTFEPTAIDTGDPVIVDGSTSNGGNWGTNDTLDVVGFGPSDPCQPFGDCAYTLRDAQGAPIPGATARIHFIGVPIVTQAANDEATFANGSGPYRIDVLANDSGETSTNPLSIVFFQVTSGNGFASAHFDTTTGRPWLEFQPTVEGCLDGVVEYYAEGCTGPAIANATFHIGPPPVDCNANCLVDALEPDDDGDGTPNDCEFATGPCDVRRNVPGSLLLFPLFDNRAGNVTLATITNTNTSFVPGPGNLPAGTIDVETVYIGRYGQDGVELPCLETNTTRRFTPGDTLTFYTGADNPNQERGFFYAFAKDPLTGAAVSWNHLIGDLMLVSGGEEIEESTPALSFRSPARPRGPTDADGDGVRDLDGVEYDGAPAELLLPRFVGQDPEGTLGGFADRLVLLALSGGPEFETVVDVTSYNDNEVSFSGEYRFRCWAAPLLVEISGAFLNSFLLDSQGGAPDEHLGPAPREYGWFRIDGDTAFSTQDEIRDPAVYAVLFEKFGPRVVVSPPFEQCSQLNGDLYPHGIFGRR